MVGVDVADAMVARAQAAEAAEPLGITYAVQDVTALPEALGSRGHKTAAYLFHYAPTRAALAAMIGIDRGAAAARRPPCRYRN